MISLGTLAENSLKAISALTSSDRAANQATKRLATGEEINHAADDAAGMSVAVRMKTDLVSDKQVSRNINDGMSLLQTAEGGIGQQLNILVRIRELQIQAMNETYTTNDLEMIQNEMDTLIAEGTRISTTNNCNFFLFKEKSITCGTSRNTKASKLLF